MKYSINGSIVNTQAISTENLGQYSEESYVECMCGLAEKQASLDFLVASQEAIVNKMIDDYKEAIAEGKTIEDFSSSFAAGKSFAEQKLGNKGGIGVLVAILCVPILIVVGVIALVISIIGFVINLVLNILTLGWWGRHQKRVAEERIKAMFTGFKVANGLSELDKAYDSASPKSTEAAGDYAGKGKVKLIFDLSDKFVSNCQKYSDSFQQAKSSDVVPDPHQLNVNTNEFVKSIASGVNETSQLYNDIAPKDKGVVGGNTLIEVIFSKFSFTSDFISLQNKMITGGKLVPGTVEFIVTEQDRQNIIKECGRCETQNKAILQRYQSEMKKMKVDLDRIHNVSKKFEKAARSKDPNLVKEFGINSEDQAKAFRNYCTQAIKVIQGRINVIASFIKCYDALLRGMSKAWNGILISKSTSYTWDELKK